MSTNPVIAVVCLQQIVEYPYGHQALLPIHNRNLVQAVCFMVSRIFSRFSSTRARIGRGFSDMRHRTIERYTLQDATTDITIRHRAKQTVFGVHHKAMRMAPLVMVRDSIVDSPVRRDASACQRFMSPSSAPERRRRTGRGYPSARRRPRR